MSKGIKYLFSPPRCNLLIKAKKVPVNFNKRVDIPPHVEIVSVVMLLV
jgi:hypothetical protein